MSVHTPVCAVRSHVHGVCVHVSPALYDQVSACMHTRVHGMCVSESPLRGREGGRRADIDPFVKGRPLPTAPPATALRGTQGPPSVSLFQPRRPTVDTPSYSGVPSSSAALPRAGGQALGSAPGSEGQWAPWRGAQHGGWAGGVAALESRPRGPALTAPRGAGAAARCLGLLRAPGGWRSAGSL